MVAKNKIIVFFCLVLIIFLNSSESYSITECHNTCEKCDQYNDPNSCTSCHPGHFKLSVHYDSNIFACVSECIGRESKKLLQRRYKFCPLKINTTPTFTFTTTSKYGSNELRLSASAISMEVYLHIIILNTIMVSFALILILICVIYIIRMTKKNSANELKNDVENVQMIPQKRHPITIIKTSEDQPSTALYNSLRNVDASEFSKGECINGGAYSRVFEGKLDEQPIAIKVALKEGRKSIHKELKIYDTVRHPHILEAVGYHLAVDNLLFLPLRRFNLSDYFLQYSSEIENQQLVNYCIQITDAMKYLHENNIIHCDLKIQNILIKESNGKEVEISDFGCAVDLLHDKPTPFHGTKTHIAYELLKIMQLLKKMYTASPNFRGTRATDVWAYAVTIWQIFSKTEILPADFQKTDQIVENYEKGRKLPKPNEMPERLWRYVFLQCFDLDPDGRPTMKELFESITSEL